MAAHAECIAPPFANTPNMCNGCKYEASMSVSRDETCERPPRFSRPERMIAMELFDYRVVQRAKHGVAGVNGNTIAYAPSKGYVGRDEFTVEVRYRQQNEVGKFLVHWNVVVQ
jgi:hypothetical protein